MIDLIYLIFVDIAHKERNSAWIALNTHCFAQAPYFYLLYCLYRSIPFLKLCRVELTISLMFTFIFMSINSAGSILNFFVCQLFRRLLCVHVGVSEDNVCVPHSSTLRIKSFDSLNTHNARSSKLLQPQYRSLVSNYSSANIDWALIYTDDITVSCRSASL